jgi:hypothetical protein
VVAFLVLGPARLEVEAGMTPKNEHAISHLWSVFLNDVLKHGHEYGMQPPSSQMIAMWRATFYSGANAVLALVMAAITEDDGQNLIKAELRLERLQVELNEEIKDCQKRRTPKAGAQ